MNDIKLSTENKKEDVKSSESPKCGDDYYVTFDMGLDGGERQSIYHWPYKMDDSRQLNGL